MARPSRTLALIADSIWVQLYSDDCGTSYPYQDSLAQRTFPTRCKQNAVVLYADMELSMQWYTADWDYARTTVYFFCAGIVFFGLINLFFRLGQQR